MPQILFICQANICRSPLGEGVVIQLLREGDFQGEWTTASAGTWAPAGRGAHPHTIAILKERGIDLSGHRSREVDREDLAAADLVLVMEAGQAEALRAEFPDQRGKIHQLSELAGVRHDIPDPVGGTVEDFRKTFSLIESFLKGREAQLRSWISQT